jgi:hypothetical protein
LRIDTCPKGGVARLICPAVRLRCAKIPQPATRFSSKMAFCEPQAVQVYILPSIRNTRERLYREEPEFRGQLVLPFLPAPEQFFIVVTPDVQVWEAALPKVGVEAVIPLPQPARFELGYEAPPGAPEREFRLQYQSIRLQNRIRWGFRRGQQASSTLH